MVHLQEGEGQVMVAQAEDRSKEFLADTGASHHICNKREFFMDMHPLPGTFNI